MQIKKFKLINDGYDGIEVELAEAVEVNNALTIDNVKRTRNLPVTLDLKGKIAGLTYFFLNLTRHWVAPFNKYFNQTTYDLMPVNTEAEMATGEGLLRNLWNDTTITGASINEGDIILTGKINVFGDKTMGLATPTINAEDDFGFYEELKARLDSIADDIIGIMTQKKIDLQPDKYMLKESFADEDVENVAERVLEKMAEKGHVVMLVDDGKDKEIPADTKKPDVKESKNAVDSDNVQEAGEANDGDGGKAKEDQHEKEAENKSTLASEGDFPDLDKDNPEQLGSKLPAGGQEGDMSQYEHSENMGTEAGEGDDNEPWKDD